MLNYLKLDKTMLKQFNKQSFCFEQSIVDEPLVQLDQLKALVLRLPENQVYASSSQVDVSANLDTAHKDHKTENTLQQSLEQLETSNSFIMVRSPETDPQYQALFTKLKADVDQLAKSINTHITDSTLYLFITSPGGTTPFHIDRYATFLMQITGEKYVHTCEPWEKSLVSDEELEKYFAKTLADGVTIKEKTLESAQINHLRPGQALHIPFIAPHWVKNGDQVSASLSVIFNTKETTDKAHAFRFNELVQRRFKLTTQPIVAQQKITDLVKIFMVRALNRVGFR